MNVAASTARYDEWQPFLSIIDAGIRTASFAD
jgi:hypothetical protein